MGAIEDDFFANEIYQKDKDISLLSSDITSDVAKKRLTAASSSGMPIEQVRGFENEILKPKQETSIPSFIQNPEEHSLFKDDIPVIQNVAEKIKPEEYSFIEHVKKGLTPVTSSIKEYNIGAAEGRRRDVGLNYLYGGDEITDIMREDIDNVIASKGERKEYWEELIIAPTKREQIERHMRGEYLSAYLGYKPTDDFLLKFLGNIVTFPQDVMTTTASSASIMVDTGGDVVRDVGMGGAASYGLGFLGASAPKALRKMKAGGAAKLVEKYFPSTKQSPFKAGKEAFKRYIKAAPFVAQVSAWNSLSQSEAGDMAYELTAFRDESGNALPREVVTGASLVYGVVAGGIEIGSLKYMAKALPGAKKVKDYFSPKAVAEIAKTKEGKAFFESLAKISAAEGLEEVTQEIVGGFVKEYAKSGEGEFGSAFDSSEDFYKFVSDMLPELPSVAVEGAKGGFGFGVGGAMATKAFEKAVINPSLKAELGKGEQSKLFESIEEMKKSSVVSESELLYQEVLSRAVNGGKITFDIDDFVENATPEQMQSLRAKFADIDDKIVEAQTAPDGQLTFDAAHMVVAMNKDAGLSPLVEFSTMSEESITQSELTRKQQEAVATIYKQLEDRNQNTKELSVIQADLEQKLSETNVYSKKNAKRIVELEMAALATFADVAPNIYKDMGRRIIDKAVAVSQDPSKIDSETAYVRELKERAAKIRAAEKQKAKKRKSKGKDLFGDILTKAKKKKSPVLNYISGSKKIQRDSNLAGELASMDITPKSHPSYFTSKGGVTDVDSIVMVEFAKDFPQWGGFKADENYVDRDVLLELLRDESFGIDIEADTDYDGVQADLDYLNKAGIDISKASDATLKAEVFNPERGQIDFEDARDDFLMQVDSTESKAFKEWFGDSKVVDADGKPLVVYHGTNVEFEEFSKQFRGMSTKSKSAMEGFFFTDNYDVSKGYASLANDQDVDNLLRQADVAERSGDFTKAEELNRAAEELEQSQELKEFIMPTYLSIKKPLVIDADGGGFLDLEDGITAQIIKAKESNYDGVIIKNFRDNAGYGQDDLATHYIAFEPTQVKSPSNRGAFDPSDPRILYQKSYHGTQKTFKQFDLEKVGSNDGNQKFGFGFYFTDNKDVASEYITSDGRVIEADIPDDDKLLDWDSSAEDMPVTLEDIVNKLDKNDEIDSIIEVIEEMEDAPYEADEQIRVFMTGSNNLDDISDYAPQEVLDKLEVLRSEVGFDAPVDELTGGDVYSLLDGTLGSKREASKFLGELGIKGVKAKDKTLTQGDTNYVVFDVNDITILEQSDIGLYQKQKGIPRGAYSRLTNTLHLFKNADLSTYIHEMGHAFLEVLNDVNTMADAPVRYQEMMGDTFKWLGVESFDEITTEKHEKFARAFEAYLRTGKSPSQKLRAAFATFRSWLINIYKSEKALDVKLDSRITSVFDRMLATDAEIDSAGEYFMFEPDPRITALMTSAEKNRYIRRSQIDEAEKKQNLFNKYTKQIRKRLEKPAIEDAKKQAEANINTDSPIWTLIRALQDGVLPDGAEVSVKLNEAEVKEILGERLMKDLPKDILDKNGERASFVADLYGFDSSLDMLLSLANEGTYNQAIKAETDIILLARHGDMFSDGTIESEALEIVHSDAQTKKLEDEYGALAGKAETKATSLVAMIDKANKIFAATGLSEALRVTSYYRAEVRAAEKVGKLLEKGDYVNATLQKEKQLINHLLYRKAIEHRKNTSKALKLFKSAVKKPTQKQIKTKQVFISDAFRERITGILEDYNFEPQPSEASVNRLVLINEWLQSNGHVGLQLPEWTKRPKDYRDMTVEEFEGLHEIISQLVTQGKNERGVWIKGKREDKDAIIESLIESSDPLKPYFEKEGKSEISGHLDNYGTGIKGLSKRIIKKGRLVAEGIDVIIEKAQQTFNYLDDGKVGMWTKAFYYPIIQAEARRNTRIMGVMENWNNIIISTYGNPKSASFDTEIFLNSGRNVTRETLVMTLLNHGSLQNQQRLANTFSQSEIKDLLSYARKEDFEFINKVWGLVDSVKDESFSVFDRLYGIKPEEVGALPFVVKTKDGGVYNASGGYFPIVYDFSLLDKDSAGAKDAERMRREEEAPSYDDMLSGNALRLNTKNGAMVSRVNETKYKLNLDIGVTMRHMTKQITYIEMAEPITQASMLLRNGKVRAQLIDKIGALRYTHLELWINDVAEGGQLTGGVPSKIMRYLRTHYTTARLMYKPATAMIQYTGVVQAAARLGEKNMAKGFEAWVAADKNDMVGRSSVMRERVEGMSYTRDISDTVRQAFSKKHKLDDFMVKYGFWMMSKAQGHVDAITWYAALHDATVNRKMNEADAIEYADATVVESQASGLVSTMSSIERGTFGKSARLVEMIKGLTMFMSYFSAKYNIAKGSYRAMNRGDKSGMRFAGDVLELYMLEGILGALVMGQVTFDEDEDGEITIKEVVYELAAQTGLQMATAIPMAREVVGKIEGFDPQQGWERQLGVVGGLASMPFSDSEKDGYFYGKRAAELASLITHFPVSQSNNIIRTMEKIERGEKVGVYDWVTYQP